MAEPKKGLLEHPYWSRVLGGLTVAAVLALCSLLYRPIWNFVTYPVPVPVWLLSILLIVLLSVTGILATLIYELNQKRAEHIPSPRDYRKDVFHGVVWHWKYSVMNNEIRELACFCPDDKSPLAEETYSSVTIYRCAACGKKFGPITGHADQIELDISRIIYGNLNSGKWKELKDKVF